MFDIPDGAIRINSTFAEVANINEISERRLYLYGEILSAESYDDEFEPYISPVSALVKKIMNINRVDAEVEAEKRKEQKHNREIAERYGKSVNDITDDNEGRKPIFLYINSPGGDLAEGFPLISAIELSKTPVYTVNIGMWSSMAFLIGIAGHKRFSLPYMTFLMHEASGFSFGKISSMEDKIAFDRKFNSDVIKTHVLKHSKLSVEEYDKKEKKEWYMLPEEALENGFIDVIVTDLDTIL